LDNKTSDRYRKSPWWTLPKLVMVRLCCACKNLDFIMAILNLNFKEKLSDNFVAWQIKLNSKRTKSLGFTRSIFLAHALPVRSDVIVNFLFLALSAVPSDLSFLNLTLRFIPFLSYSLFFVINKWKFWLTTISNPSTKALSLGWWELWRGKNRKKKKRVKGDTQTDTNNKKNYASTGTLLSFFFLNAWPVPPRTMRSQATG